MKDKLPGVDSLNINEGSAWPAIIGGVIGGIFSLIISTVFYSHAFIYINTVVIGLIIGSLYGRIVEKDWRVIFLGAIIGGFCGLHLISFGVFIFGGLYAFLCFYAFRTHKWGWYILFSVIFWFVMLFLFGYSGYSGSVDDLVNTYSSWDEKIVGIWLYLPGVILIIILLLVIFFIIQPFLILIIPCLIAVLASIGGGIIAWRSFEQLSARFSVPFFTIPLFSFIGYFIGCKINEGKKPKKKKVPKGGLLMAEDPPFPKQTSEGISPVAFSEKAMIQDLLSALNNSNLLSVKLQSWKARAKAQDQLRAFEMIREMLVKETDIIKAYTVNQQARLDFENLKEFNQYLQKERLKAQLAEEKYKQAEIEEKLKMMRLEEEKKRLQLQQEIERLKRAQGMTESKIEKIKKEQLEKIDFQEEIRKVKAMRLADRVEYLHNRKKEIKKKYSPEEAEEIIDEFDRIMVEEGLKEE